MENVAAVRDMMTAEFPPHLHVEDGVSLCNICEWASLQATAEAAHLDLYAEDGMIDLNVYLADQAALIAMWERRRVDRVPYLHDPF